MNSFEFSRFQLRFSSENVLQDVENDELWLRDVNNNRFLSSSRVSNAVDKLPKWECKMLLNLKGSEFKISFTFHGKRADVMSWYLRRMEAKSF